MVDANSITIPHQSIVHRIIASSYPAPRPRATPRAPRHKPRDNAPRENAPLKTPHEKRPRHTRTDPRGEQPPQDVDFAATNDYPFRSHDPRPFTGRRRCRQDAGAPTGVAKKYDYSIWQVIAASAAGTVIEWYDFYIFGSLAAIISPLFYPPGNDTSP